jgi:hypothetical protein
MNDRKLLEAGRCRSTRRWWEEEKRKHDTDAPATATHYDLSDRSGCSQNAIQFHHFTRPPPALRSLRFACFIIFWKFCFFWPVRVERVLMPKFSQNSREQDSTRSLIRFSIKANDTLCAPLLSPTIVSATFRVLPPFRPSQLVT